MGPNPGIDLVQGNQGVGLYLANSYVLYIKLILVLQVLFFIHTACDNFVENILIPDKDLTLYRDSFNYLLMSGW